MAGPRYPLEALRKLRDDRAEEQAHGLAVQIARSQAAEERLREREAARRTHAERTAQTRSLESERLAQGVGGHELQRLAEFEVAVRAQAGVLERAEGEARQALSQERAQEQKMREVLAAREAEAKLVRNHEDSFHERQLDLQQKAEEEAALEQWSARRH
jgi:hypothetical protein